MRTTPCFYPPPPPEINTHHGYERGRVGLCPLQFERSAACGRYTSISIPSCPLWSTVRKCRSQNENRYSNDDNNNAERERWIHDSWGALYGTKVSYLYGNNVHIRKQSTTTPFFILRWFFTRALEFPSVLDYGVLYNPLASSWASMTYSIGCSSQMIFYHLSTSMFVLTRT